MTTVEMVVKAQGAFVAELQAATVEELRRYAEDLEKVVRLYANRRDLVLSEVRRRGKDGRRERPRAPRHAHDAAGGCQRPGRGRGRRCRLK